MIFSAAEMHLCIAMSDGIESVNDHSVVKTKHFFVLFKKKPVEIDQMLGGRLQRGLSC